MTNHWHFGLLPMRCQRPRARRVIDQQYAFGLLDHLIGAHKEGSRTVSAPIVLAA